MRSPPAAAAVLLVVTVLLAATGPSAAQSDALSNSNGCLGVIPKCEPGACVARDIMGVARWACLRCLANYDAVVDGSGQDNIIQCVCPLGFYEAGANATSCTRCPVGSYCPGGDKAENPTSRGTPMQCGPNMVTRSSGARSQTDCVSPAGFAQTSPNVATACDRSTYAPPLNRLAKCLRCQSGLAEPTNSTLTDGQRATKRAVCMLPPGKFMSQGLVRMCPQGFYRENFVEFDAPIGTLCRPCRSGITTDGAGAVASSLCNRVVAGFGIAAVNNVSGPASIPALPTNISDGGLPQAYVCEFGYYSLGGYCAQCPSGTVTQTRGAKSIEECMVPPGYFIDNGTMLQCGSGFFREGWRLWSDYRAVVCTMCGDNIRSEPRDLDQNPLATNGSLVRATSSSCFVDAGQGMIARGFNLFIGQNCPEDTYGAAGRVYGWAAAPCKPCPRNMITDGVRLVNNSDVCINDDGYGYASEGASRCAPGFYSAKGSRRPCVQCASGRTTADDPSLQRYITDCLVRPGFGVVNSTASPADAFYIDTSNMSPDMVAVMAVLECPVGYWSPGGDVGSNCLKCPCGSTTKQVGSTSSTDCNVCLPGYGLASPNATECSPCLSGTYQAGGGTECTTCPAATFYPPVDGVGAIYTVNSTTLFNGVFGQEACVPWHSQLSPEAGQAYFSPENTAMLALTNATYRFVMTDCIASCPANQCCLMQYTVSNHTCRIATLAPVAFGANATTSTQLLYKLPPSAMGSASSVTAPLVSAKTIASGYYATCSIPDAVSATWQTAGTNLGPDARTFSVGGAVWDTASKSLTACQRRCDESNVCWGFVYNVTTRACLYRGGVDALLTRSFFILPPTGAQTNTTAQCPPMSMQGQLPTGFARCSAPCTLPQLCLGGVCQCPQGLTFCSGKCVNATSDITNCGVCGSTCAANQQCFNGVCAESVVPCGAAKTFSGNEGNYTYSVTVGSNGTAWNFRYDAYSMPDRFSVYLPNGTMIFSTMSGDAGNPSKSCYCNLCKGVTVANGNINLPKPKGVSAVKIVVNGYCSGTGWEFTAGCAK